MFHIVIALEVALWFETHQSHAYSIKLLDLTDLFHSQLDFLASNRIVCTDFLSVESFTGLIANESLGRPELFIVHGVNFLDAGLLGRNDSAKKAESNLRSWRYVEHTLAKCSLLELFLADALHEFKDTRLGPFNSKKLCELLIFIVRDDVCVEF